ncbi:hypothetical protein [Chitinophaga cymbidii]|uniref:SGNH hydrolase-type esterase domain-containing protein n=1 Tax=Chitinophaga cymbidii TaxID=1096750 RepID=A0A512RP97_9BACT|nr:hypothetical protein [Chitinophaga cymbidii]GEP97525.1 hypothetical protein CCY01nite_37850 [Chitinophaga cymbidii]
MSILKFPLVLLTLSALYAFGQEKDFSQEAAEKEALQKYEAAHPPRDSMPMPAPAEQEAFLGAHLVRSATLLATSTAQRRLPVKIIIYGQSITGSSLFTAEMSNYLKAHFPHADITLENRCIGGFGASQIIRTAPHDIFNANADLIIFHVYGGEKTGELEELFTGIRRYTTADVLLMNHHVNGDQKKPNETSAAYLRYIAQKYDCELADISAEWPVYLETNNLAPKDLLRDNVHPNRNGNWLLAQLVGRHIRYNPLFPNPSYRSVQTYFTAPAFDKVNTSPISYSGTPWRNEKGTAVSDSRNSKMKLTFHGNRVDVITELPSTGTARILIDGKPPTAYTMTRPSAGPGTWWPGIRKVSHIKPLIPEDWTLKIESINADTTVFTYSVHGTKTGNDGAGSSAETFVSKSGRVVIEPSDVIFANIKNTFKTAVPVGFITHWSVVPMFVDTFRAPDMTDKKKLYKTTLVWGLENGVHTLEVVPNGDGAVGVTGFEVYRPGVED